MCLEEEEEEEDDEDKKKKKRRGLLPLLMTCRRIYTEAMPVLYGENTFSMLHLYSVTSLAETVLPQRLHTIRKVELGWYFYVPYPLYRRRGKSVIGQPTTMDECPPYDIATWERVWDILAGMEGLRELRVDLVGRWSETLTKDEEGMLLGPALKVERPRVWEMRVEWDGGGVDWEGDGAPFRVVRGGGVGEGAEVE